FKQSFVLSAYRGERDMAAILLRLIVGIVLALVMGPILIVIIASFSAGESLSFPPPGFSLRWFVAFFEIAEMRNAFVLSIVLAVASAMGATLVGLLGAVYVSRHRNAFSTLMQVLVMAPMVFPALILGLALLLLYKSVNMSVLPGLFIAHVVVCLPYSFR